MHFVDASGADSVLPFSSGTKLLWDANMDDGQTTPSIYSVESPELTNFTGVIIKCTSLNYGQYASENFYEYVGKNTVESVSKYAVGNNKAICRVFTVTEDTVSWGKGGYFQTNIGYKYYEDDRHAVPKQIYGCNMP